MRRAGMLGVAVALWLATGQARAIDVDRIEIHSRLGEPLVAEIPITGASAAELAQIQAQLASSTTFARSGLARPQGVVAGLRFEVVRGPRPVIRVTSDMPVQEEFLTFLVQVDAPQGRLVREYSLALGASPSLPAPVAPQIQAPVQAAPALIARQPDPADALPAPIEPELQAPVVAEAEAAPPIPVIGRAPAPAPPPAPGNLQTTAPVPLHGDGASRATAAPRRAATRPVAAAQARPPAPVQRRVTPAQSPVLPPRAAAGGYGQYPVRRGDTLTGVVGRMGLDGATLPQAMLAVLRTNPQAFGAGNINLLQQGMVLRAPAASELSRLDPAAAEAMVRLQTEQWRSGDLPPVAAPVQAAAAAAAAAADGATAVGVAASTARLEIAPASADEALQPGSAAGTTAGGGADPERAAADLVATRYTEFQQMQQRIAELEQTQQAQQRLLELKDRQLAAQRPQTAGVWPWLVALLAVAAAMAMAWRPRGPRQPGRIAKALAARVRTDRSNGVAKAPR
jgi:pilus assembly protein FimV